MTILLDTTVRRSLLHNGINDALVQGIAPDRSEDDFAEEGKKAKQGGFNESL